MIQLASDPNASRPGFRPSNEEAEGKARAFQAQRGRSGHAWPFLSRPSERPARPESHKPASGDNGS